ncbi:hypothetical protein T11_7743 [Trichinella zimbabwensis]|uniref:Uncharacterized protein n=1 Tax=Trichinella zimbabwensis TaxID=268475 RepID=A0A0V1HAU4_9BILA|nr:hypothetical protein T11_7743 [Trichinella zimbabwensis]
MGCLAGESQSLGGRKLAGGRRSVGKSAAQSWKTWRDSLQQNMLAIAYHKGTFCKNVSRLLAFEKSSIVTFLGLLFSTLALKSTALILGQWRSKLFFLCYVIILQQQALDELHRNLLIRSLDAKDQRLEFDRQSTKDYATYRFIVQRFSNRL